MLSTIKTEPVHNFFITMRVWLTMRLGFAVAVLSGLAISAITLVILGGGGKSISMKHSDTEASIGLPPSDTRPAGAFETATFALG